MGGVGRGQESYFGTVLDTYLYQKMVLLTVYLEIFFGKCFFDVNTNACKLKSAFYNSMNNFLS